MSARTGASPRAASTKYDLLAALSAQALRGGKIGERLTLRLVTLITARYNWARDELSIGRAEIARLWSVDERTVKREIGKLKQAGFLVVKRPGVRGRVTVYGLGLEALRAATQEAAVALGPDFEERLAPGAGQGDAAAGGEVVPFPGAPAGAAGGASSPAAGPAEWQAIRGALQKRNPDRFACWFAALEAESDGAGGLVLRAPTGFLARYVGQHYSEDLRAAAIEAGVRVGALALAGPEA
ncbi:DnaA N-terminal domain-containing protein [Rhodovulum sp. DZ06]|uniref:DnaA N-terminal domain-containing protein n=1 Tax=Rhodovulum sp. DZ06 TaxID=3425126 RepID=UPI003D341C7F